MYFGFGLLCVYLLIGGLVARAVDRSEMKKHVPYAQASSLLPLRFWRIATIVIGMLIAVPIILTATPLPVYEHWQYRIIRWRFNRSVRKLKRYIKKQKEVGSYDTKRLELLRLVAKSAVLARKLHELQQKEKQDGDSEGSTGNGGSTD